MGGGLAIARLLLTFLPDVTKQVFNKSNYQSEKNDYEWLQKKLLVSPVIYSRTRYY
jgi:hypothetical protein